MALARESTPGASMPIEITIEELHAYEEGTVGCFDGRMTFISGDRRVPVRVTGVAHQEDGRWKSVQTHASIGVPVEHQFDEMFTAAAAPDVQTGSPSSWPVECRAAPPRLRLPAWLHPARADARPQR